MAAPTLALLNSTSIDTAESTTGWTKFDTLDTDIKKEGNNGITGTFRSDATVGYFDDAGGAPITAVGKTFRMWINTTNVPYLDTAANGGCELSIYDNSVTEYKTIFSSEDYFGGWFQVVIDMDSFTTVTLANVDRWGIRLQMHTSAKNIDNVWVDALKYLDGYSMVGGTTGDRISLLTTEEADRGTTTLYGYGIISKVGKAFYCTGEMQFGTGATTTYFEMDGEILLFENKPVAAGLYKLSAIGTGTNVTIKNSVIDADGSTDATRYILDFSDTDIASLDFTDNRVVRASTSAFKTGQTVTGNTFDNCRQITHGGATMNNSAIKNYEGTAGTAALLYNVAVDPNGEMDDMSFTMGIADTHAIEFGTNTPTTISLSGQSYTGYNTSTGSNPTASTGANDCAIYNNSGKTITINIVGDGALPSVRNGASSTTTIVLSKGYTLTNIANPSEVTILDRDISLLDITATPATLSFGNATATERMGQSFQVTTAGKAERIRLNLRKVGTPTDDITIRLVNGVPGSTLISTSVTIDGADLTTSFVEFDVDLNGKYSLATATTYGIEIQRSGAVDAANYYQIEYNTTATTHTAGTWYTYNASWGTSTGDLLFSVMEAASDNELHHVETVTTGTTTYTHGGTTKAIEVLVAALYYKQVVLVDDIGAADKSLPILQIPDLVYSP